MRTGAQYRKPCITDARSGSLNIARLAPEDRGDRLRGQRTPQRLGRRCLHPAAGSGTRRDIEAAADPQFFVTPSIISSPKARNCSRMS